MKGFLVVFLVFFLEFQHARSSPTIYHVNRDGIAEPELVPVWSTAIPLEDLPEYKVGLGFGLVENKKEIKSGKSKVELEKKLKNKFSLITASNKHRFVAPAGVRELSKEEFENFNLA